MAPSARVRTGGSAVRTGRPAVRAGRALAPAPAVPAALAPQAPSPARPGMPRIQLESGAAPSGPPAGSGPTAAPEAPSQQADVPTASAPAEAQPSAPAQPPAPVAAAPSEKVANVRVQPVPKAAACAAPSDRDIAKERDWTRRNFSSLYHSVSGSISRIMSESPGLRGASRSDANDALTDLVAVKLYLSGDSGQVDKAVKAATVGPHVPLARCVASGLRRLPSYRGCSLVRTLATPAERAWFREGRLVTEWGFCAARTNVAVADVGDTDFLVWSMTARRTGLVDPARPDQVLFVPGTSFKVLRVDDEGERHAVLMRELLSSEIGDDGSVDATRVPLDEIALAGLEQALKVVEGIKDSDGDGEVSAGSGWPPGLISTRQGQIRSAPHQTVLNEGATP